MSAPTPPPERVCRRCGSADPSIRLVPTYLGPREWQCQTECRQPLDRALLVEVRRWARANRWWLGWSGWHSADGSTVVDWTDDRDEITVRRGGATLGLDYPVASVREAVDILCVLGVLPARFSSAHRAAQAELARVTRERDAAADQRDRYRAALDAVFAERDAARAELAQWRATYGEDIAAAVAALAADAPGGEPR